MTATDPRAAEGVEAQYRQALDQGRFQIQHCDACDRAVFYPRMLCPHCGAAALSWQTPDGRGTVYSTTVVRRKPEAGGDYNVALVDLDEGARLMSRIVGMPADRVRIGLRVRASVSREGERALVVFGPMEAA